MDGGLLLEIGLPLQAIPGWASLTVLLAGLALLGRALLSALAGRGGLGGAVAGAAAAGLGVLVLAQQLGISRITETSLVTWTALPGAVGGVVHALASRASLGARARGGVSGRPPVRPPAPPTEMPKEGRPVLPIPKIRLPFPRAEAPEAEIPRPVQTLRPPAAETVEAEPEPESEPGGPIGAGRPADRDPPRTAFARLECPEAVVAEREFDLVVGLAESPDSRVVAEPLRRPSTSVGPYRITIQVVAEGMSLARPSQSWRLDLPVTAEDPYPYRTLHLKAGSQGEPVRATSVRAMFSIAGQPIGLAVRSVAIVREAALLASASPGTPQAPGVDLSLPGGQVAPDLTIRIERAESQASGRLLLQLLAADLSIDLPDAPLVIDIGTSPERFLRTVVTAMTAAEGRTGIYQTLMGIGLTISDQLPEPFWQVFQAVGARVRGRAPMVLILSAEPYVPWELAVVDPPLDPGSPPFLCAQANVGRWVLGQRRPKLPPPASLSVGEMAVVSGVYDRPGWARLVEAEAEADDLAGIYRATRVEARIRLVLDLLAGRPTADVIHFAVHGSYDPGGGEDGLILVDGLALDPLTVRGVRPHGAPFVFLNACQVGSGSEVLGDYAGMAEAFLFAGASGVVAPLWSIDDRTSRQLAVGFYERAFAGGSPGETLRRERAAFRDAPETTSATYLAYQFFGHPALRLERRAG